MTRLDAAATYRRLRSLYIVRQRSLCTVYGQRATAEQFDTDAHRYLHHVAGFAGETPTPAEYVYAARAMLCRVMPDFEAHVA